MLYTSLPWGMADAQPEPKQKVNKIKQRGKFSGFEVIDEKRKHLEPHELRAFFAQVQEDPFWGPYWYLDYYFGCRVSEPALILREDISFKDDLILIRRLKKRNTESGYSESVYGLTPDLKKVIKRVVNWTKESDLLENPWLFPSPRKTFRQPKERLGQIRRLDSGYSAISRMSAHKAFSRAAAAAGIPERLRHSHTLRHTRATLMLAQGKKPEQVQFLLGHNNLATTLRYIGVAHSLRLRYQVDAELGDGFEDISDQMIRKARRRTAKLAVSSYGVEEGEFGAQGVDPGMLEMPGDDE